MPVEDRTADESRSAGRSARRIQSISVGFALIRHLAAAPGGMSPKEMGQAAEMSPSQVHMYMASFIVEGLAVQDPVTSRYDLGPYALELGLAAMRRLDALEIARETMLSLRAETAKSVFLTVWGNSGPTIVAKVDGYRPSADVLRVGYVLPTLDSSTGRLFFAYLAGPQTVDIVKREREDPLSPSSHLTDEHISSIVQRIRRSGLATHDGYRDSYNAIAAPLLDHSGLICAALTITGPEQDFEGYEEGPVALVLRRAAKKVSFELGYRDGHRVQAIPYSENE
jgi:DNA-binding IclR family transcriptional regulator